MAVVGRICCDTNGKLNSSSLLLLESGTNCFGESVPLNVADVNQYSLFPGKVRNRFADNLCDYMIGCVNT